MDFPAMLDDQRERLGSLSMFHLAIRLWGTPKTCWVNLQLLENPNYCNSTIAKCMLIGGYWWFGTFVIFFSRIDGMSSFPLTNSYFSRWLKLPTSHVSNCFPGGYMLRDSSGHDFTYSPVADV